MKNNVSFLLVTATAAVAMALCFGSVADFNPAQPQVASTVAPAAETAPASDAPVTLRVE